MKPRTEIRPERVTKPIQLLAAWLVGLVLIDTCFLVAAIRLEAGTVERLVLVVAAAANVPIFLAALFLLQTRFRPELQEDSYYSKYLDRKTNAIVSVPRERALVHAISRVQEAIQAEPRSPSAVAPAAPSILQSGKILVALNRSLPDFPALRSKIKAAGVPLQSIFGTGEVPAYRMVAISENVPLDAKIEAIRLAAELGLEAYTEFDQVEEDIHEDVLLGSYGIAGFSITPELIELLKTGPEPVDLELYQERNALPMPRRR